MSTIQFKPANCKSCYRCIRACALKAISFKDNQAQIIEDQCIFCGKCAVVCPQNAKQVTSHLGVVRGYIDGGEKVFASLSPSFVAAFPHSDFAALRDALITLGFADVFETGAAARQVARSYGRLMEEGSMENIISTSCPACVMLVEKYYPSLVPCLAPVADPATSHARMLRRQFGEDIRVIYIGSCISQKHASKGEHALDAVLTFDELADWLRLDKASVKPSPVTPSSPSLGSRSNFYLPGGVLQGIVASLDPNSRYKTVSADGLTRCIDTLNAIRDNNIQGYMVELYACSGACVGGPGMYQHGSVPYLLAKELVLTKTEPTDEYYPDDFEIDEEQLLKYEYCAKPLENKLPTNEEISEILRKMLSSTGGSLLNCGSCGYPTCRQKAIAIYQGKADMDMCLPYMRHRAESMSNVILENTPNAIFMIDSELRIVQSNPAAAELFGVLPHTLFGQIISQFLPIYSFDRLQSTGTAILDELVHSVDGRLTLRQSLVPVQGGGILVLVKDETSEQRSREEMETLRYNTLNITQNIIDKQMRAAQEIASLLGETTGETKAALVKLKKALKDGGTI